MPIVNDDILIFDSGEIPGHKYKMQLNIAPHTRTFKEVIAYRDHETPPKALVKYYNNVNNYSHGDPEDLPLRTQTIIHQLASNFGLATKFYLSDMKTFTAE